MVSKGSKISSGSKVGSGSKVNSGKSELGSSYQKMSYWELQLAVMGRNQLREKANYKILCRNEHI